MKRVASGEDVVIEWSLDEVVAPYLSEIEERRRRELGIKGKYVRKSLQFLISESNKKIAKYDTQLRQLPLIDDPNRLNIQGNRAKEEAHRNDLNHLLTHRLAQIEQERHLW